MEIDPNSIVGSCDKCKQPVTANNDAYALARLAGHPWTAQRVYRHLLPVEGCPGSPSRAQFLEGQDKDFRGYPYDKKLEPKYREAYKLLLAGENGEVNFEEEE